MRFGRNPKSPSIDIDHMKALHEECIEQLELMKVSLDAAQLANYLMRDKLDTLAASHWHSYLDIIHLICMHDETLNQEMKKIGFELIRNETDIEHQYEAKRLLLLGLLRTLLRHHRRVIYMYRMIGEPTKDYLTDAAPQERGYLVNIIEMIHHTL